jgi:hypothetical protein
MATLTMFTWGYWGWGTSTAQLIEAVDAVETSRGFEPPLFVDIRISRSVRAPGFNGKAFEKAVGESRYRWMDSLGNVGVKDGGPMRIKDPASAGTLLEIAEESADARRRVLFFCSCEFPGHEADGCHRTAVARLLLEAAVRRNLALHVVEWPGGEPRIDNFQVCVSASGFDKLCRGAASIPLEEPVHLAEMAAVPWLSMVAVREKGNNEELPLRFLTGPARYGKKEWHLPIYGHIGDDMPAEQIPRYVLEQRDKYGFASRHASR